MFYYPSYNPRVVDCKILEDVEPSVSVYPQRFYLEETRELTEGPLYEGCLIVLLEN
jgi:hypothetical protein